MAGRCVAGPSPAAIITRCRWGWRDLLVLGALSFDTTYSRARLPIDDGNCQKGGSYRLSYSKSFDEYDSQITFAGYRFSEQNFMTMSEYLTRVITVCGMASRENVHHHL